MSSLRFFFTYSREFLRHWGSYILLIVGTNIALEMLVIPLVQFLIAFILKQGNIPYVSNTNLLTILTRHPAVLGALLLLLAFVLALVFLQFTFQLFGIKSIRGVGSIVAAFSICSSVGFSPVHFSVIWYQEYSNKRESVSLGFV